MACDTIVALPTTITGSIGVFGIVPNISPFLEDKLGVTTDVVNTGKYSDMNTVTRPLSNFEKAVFQKSVDEIYETFTQDRKSTRLNSSHVKISYAVFCLKKKTKTK